MVLRHQNGDLVVMKILAPADNVDTSLEVHRLYMIVIVGVEIVLKIYLSEAFIFFLTKQQTPYPIDW